MMWWCIFVLFWTFNVVKCGLTPEIIDQLTPDPNFSEACGYGSCPSALAGKGGINVHIVPHTHWELGLNFNFKEHYTGELPGVKSDVNMKRALDFIVSELTKHNHRTFALSDMAYFFQWWNDRDITVHRMVYALLRTGRLSFVGGGWSMSDEAINNYHAIIESFSYTLRKINETFLECGRPLVSWQADVMGHSREFASLMAQMGYDGLFINPISFDDELARMRRLALEMLWRGSDDLGETSDIYTHKLFDGYWSPSGFCFGLLCVNDPRITHLDDVIGTAESRATQFAEMIYKRQSPNYNTSHVMVMMGNMHGYWDAPQWFINTERLIDTVNTLPRTSQRPFVYAFFSSPQCFLKSIREENPALELKQDDFFPLSFDHNSVLIGHFASSPSLKLLMRQGLVYLQMAKQLHFLADLDIYSEVIEDMMWTIGVFQDHTIVTGYAKPEVKNYYIEKMFVSIQKSLLILKRAFNKLRDAPPELLYYRCTFNESKCWPYQFKIYVVHLYNPLAWSVEFPVRFPILHMGDKIHITDPDNNPVEFSVIKIPDFIMRHRNSTLNHDIVFIAKIPALGYISYCIERTIETQVSRKRRSKANVQNTQTKDSHVRTRGTSTQELINGTNDDYDRLDEYVDNTISVKKFNDKYKDYPAEVDNDDFTEKVPTPLSFEPSVSLNYPLESDINEQEILEKASADPNFLPKNKRTKESEYFTPSMNSYITNTHNANNSTVTVSTEKASKESFENNSVGTDKLIKYNSTEITTRRFIPLRSYTDKNGLDLDDHFSSTEKSTTENNELVIRVTEPTEKTVTYLNDSKSDEADYSNYIVSVPEKVKEHNTTCANKTETVCKQREPENDDDSNTDPNYLRELLNEKLFTTSAPDEEVQNADKEKSNIFDYVDSNVPTKYEQKTYFRDDLNYQETPKIKPVKDSSTKVVYNDGETYIPTTLSNIDMSDDFTEKSSVVQNTNVANNHVTNIEKPLTDSESDEDSSKVIPLPVSNNTNNINKEQLIRVHSNKTVNKTNEYKHVNNSDRVYDELEQERKNEATKNVSDDVPDEYKKYYKDFMEDYAYVDGEHVKELTRSKTFMNDEKIKTDNLPPVEGNEDFVKKGEINEKAKIEQDSNISDTKEYLENDVKKAIEEQVYRSKEETPDILGFDKENQTTAIEKPFEFLTKNVPSYLEEYHNYSRSMDNQNDQKPVNKFQRLKEHDSLSLEDYDTKIERENFRKSFTDNKKIEKEHQKLSIIKDKSLEYHPEEKNEELTKMRVIPNRSTSPEPLSAPTRTTERMEKPLRTRPVVMKYTEPTTKKVLVNQNRRMQSRPLNTRRKLTKPAPEQIFIKNKYIRINVDTSTHKVAEMVLANGVRMKLDLQFYYYASDDPETMGTRDLFPGSRLFRPLESNPVPILDYMTTKVVKTKVVEEIHCEYSKWAFLIVRLYKDSPVIEVNWALGPIPEHDQIGKEVFIRYQTDLLNDGAFYTDSNGRQTIKRLRNLKPMYESLSSDVIGVNFYPINSKISIIDLTKNLRFSVFPDRGTGGSSLYDGEIDIMLARRILTDDSGGMGTIVNDSCWLRGSHHLYLSKADYYPNKIFEKKFAKEQELVPQVFLTAPTGVTRPVWLKLNNKRSFIATDLPVGIHLLTLERRDSSTILIRLENYLEKSDTRQGKIIKVFIRDLFSNIIIDRVEETMLAGNIWKKNFRPMRWKKKEKFVKNFNQFYGENKQVEFADENDNNSDNDNIIDIQNGITLKPQQIRTFVCWYSLVEL